MRSYEEIEVMVSKALDDDVMFWVGVAFAESRDSEDVRNIVFDAYYEAASEPDFDMSVKDYLFEMLDNVEPGCENMKVADAYENEAEAEQDGFYWFEEIDRWLKVQF